MRGSGGGASESGSEERMGKPARVGPGDDNGFRGAKTLLLHVSFYTGDPVDAVVQVKDKTRENSFSVFKLNI